jgi:tetratricopeptide (TPR) repeat protein
MPKAPNTATATSTPWAFRTRFRRSAFGWKASRLAMNRIHEALTEIRAVARHDPARAAEGAVLLLEKLSPALCQIDSSSGALGNATCATVQELAPLISNAPVSATVRKKWLDRLFEAIQEDDPPYIESLGDHWGELCATPELASDWSDQLLPSQHNVLRERASGTFAYFAGTSLCYSALFKAGRHEEILQLLSKDRHPIWPYLIWGARVLAARGQIDEAIAYARDRAGINTSEEALARFAEDLLLKAGRRAEAFDQYALRANQAHTHLATFRALAKKYPERAKDKLLSHLVGSTPTAPGKWFATAKTLKLFDQATRLAWASPCDPKTLNRAARDHLNTQPAFAMQCALAALHWMSTGHGYELTGLDVQEAHRLAIDAASQTQQTEQAHTAIAQMLATDKPMRAWMKQALGLVPSPALRKSR